METNSERRSAIKEWHRAQPEPKPAPPGVAWDDLNDAEKAAVQAIIDRNRSSRGPDHDPWNRSRGGGNIPLGSLGIPCPRIGGGGGGVIIPNPFPRVPSVPMPDLPNPGDTSTNGGTNRVPFATNPTNVTIRTNPSNVNTNRPSTNRITNGNGRGGEGVGLRAGFN